MNNKTPLQTETMECQFNQYESIIRSLSLLVWFNLMEEQEAYGLAIRSGLHLGIPLIEQEEYVQLIRIANCASCDEDGYIEYDSDVPTANGHSVQAAVRTKCNHDWDEKDEMELDLTDLLLESLEHIALERRKVGM